MNHSKLNIKKDWEGFTVRNEIEQRTRGFLSPIVTAISGLAPTGARPRFVWTATEIHSVTLAWLPLSITSSWSIVANGFGWAWLGLIPLSVSTAGAARATMTTVLHDLTHRIGSKKAKERGILNSGAGLIGELLSTLLQIQPFSSDNGYVFDHLKHHNSKIFLNTDDPDVVTLQQFGIFIPNQSDSVIDVKKRFWKVILSPGFHYEFLKIRILHAFNNVSNSVIFLRASYLLAMSYSVYSFDVALEFFIAVFIPVGILLQMAALLQFSTEHRWMMRKN